MLSNKVDSQNIFDSNIDSNYDYANLQHNLENVVKRFIDVVCSMFLIMFFSPIFFFVAALIKLDSRGPVFFKQKRCGKMGKEFFMLKFRTMVDDAEILKKNLINEMEGPVFKIRRDPRITRIGSFLRRWSFDELPQFINIFKGEMSLVGPRPLAKEEMAGYEVWKDIRLTVKPGLTGLWQVYGRSTGKFSDWVKYDIEYVRNRSIFLDIKIIFLTVFAVLSKKGAC
ncbi:MAG: exopolysaccharide biosynthesis polyprenyl glycosylphosphotransferase [Candidatus Kuenenia sp.]|nr:exopolysaccharide biosynthesis polyprenyl glycosylphosphotransferase [Candidatus Kuenenia hertensis]